MKLIDSLIFVLSTTTYLRYINGKWKNIRPDNLQLNQETFDSDFLEGDVRDTVVSRRKLWIHHTDVLTPREEEER